MSVIWRPEGQREPPVGQVWFCRWQVCRGPGPRASQTVGREWSLSTEEGVISEHCRMCSSKTPEPGLWWSMWWQWRLDFFSSLHSPHIWGRLATGPPFISYDPLPSLRYEQTFVCKKASFPGTTSFGRQHRAQQSGREIPVLACVHSLIGKHIGPHTYAHVHTLMWTHICTHPHSCTCTHLYIFMTFMAAHTIMYRHRHSSPCVCTHTHTYGHTYIQCSYIQSFC